MMNDVRGLVVVACLVAIGAVLAWLLAWFLAGVQELRVESGAADDDTADDDDSGE
jgi:hypothetical protein